LFVLKFIFYPLGLLLLSLAFYLWQKHIYLLRFFKIRKHFEMLENTFNGIARENTELKVENAELEKQVSATVALFNITKEICRSLDQEKVFAYFKAYVSKFLEVDDCKFIEGGADLDLSPDYTAIPLEIDKQPLGYLVAERVKPEYKDKFYILSQQVILGLKRALLYKRVQELAITDSLTGIFSRRYFLERFREEVERAKKNKLGFSFLIVDVDNFKYCNDNYGHLVGDAVLKEVAQAMQENIRQVDLLGKYGGDEFALCLSLTGAAEAEFVAQRIRKTIETKDIRAYDENLKVTVSIGIAIYPLHAKSADNLIEKADRALYQAKKSGKNKVCIF